MTLQKRDWANQINIDEAIGCSLNWLVKARQKNVLSLLPPTLYTAYVVDDMPHIGLMHGISSIFKYSSKDSPETDRTRDVALRLLAVAIKSHYFLAKESVVRHEPYLFTIPDISQPESLIYGLVYRIESRPSQTVIVSTADLSFISSQKSNAYRFPVVLTKNSYKWFDKKHWSELAQKAQLFDNIMKPWIAQKQADIIEKWNNTEDFPFGTLFDIPYELKDYMKLTGVKWADTLKKWYLPLGFDVEPVKEYQKWLEIEYKDHKEDLEARFWRYIKFNKNKTSNTNN